MARQRDLDSKRRARLFSTSQPAELEALTARVADLEARVAALESTGLVDQPAFVPLLRTYREALEVARQSYVPGRTWPHAPMVPALHGVSRGWRI